MKKIIILLILFIVVPNRSFAWDMEKTFSDAVKIENFKQSETSAIDNVPSLDPSRKEPSKEDSLDSEEQILDAVVEKIVELMIEKHIASGGERPSVQDIRKGKLQVKMELLDNLDILEESKDASGEVDIDKAAELMLSREDNDADMSTAKADVMSISTGLELYYLDKGNYPSMRQGLKVLLVDDLPYLAKESIDPWGNPYVYRYPAQKSDKPYDVFSYGPDGIEGEDDIANY